MRTRDRIVLQAIGCICVVFFVHMYRIIDRRIRGENAVLALFSKEATQGAAGLTEVLIWKGVEGDDVKVLHCADESTCRALERGIRASVKKPDIQDVLESSTFSILMKFSDGGEFSTDCLGIGAENIDIWIWMLRPGDAFPTHVFSIASIPCDDLRAALTSIAKGDDRLHEFPPGCDCKEAAVVREGRH